MQNVRNFGLERCNSSRILQTSKTVANECSLAKSTCTQPRKSPLTSVTRVIHVTLSLSGFIFSLDRLSTARWSCRGPGTPAKTCRTSRPAAPPASSPWRSTRTCSSSSRSGRGATSGPCLNWLKGSIGEGPNHSNFSHQSSVRIQEILCRKFARINQKFKKVRNV